jgi:hypothetical protein
VSEVNGREIGGDRGEERRGEEGGMHTKPQGPGITSL